jgi:hypothetical protein
LPKTGQPSSFTNKFVVAAYEAANEKYQKFWRSNLAIATANAAAIAVCLIVLPPNTPLIVTFACERQFSRCKSTSRANQQNRFAPKLWTVRGSQFK